ncbi:MAG: Rab family GTPase [Candidatus Helarchaeota archaeon]
MVEEYKKKVVLIGSFSVGKTALIHKFVENRFISDYKATIGVNLMSKKMEIENGVLVNFSIWDIAGQIAFKPVWKNFYSKASGALIIFDVTREITYNEVPGWYHNIYDYINEKIPAILVANKIDLKDERVVSQEKGMEMAEKLNIGYLETSAKTGTRVEDAFKFLGLKMLDLKNETIQTP